MRREKKKRISEELREDLREAGIVYLTDFTGLDVKAMTDFRDRLRENGVQYKVVKNTLMRRALEGLDFPDIGEHLNGPTGLVLGTDDPVLPARVVTEFAAEHEDRPTVKVGVVDRRTISPEEIGTMATLPPRDELLGSIARGLTAPVADMVNILNGLIRDIALLIEQVAEKRQEG